MGNHQLLMLCHGVSCGLKQICERFHQMTAFCPQRAKGEEPTIIDHCDEESRDCFVEK